MYQLSTKQKERLTEAVYAVASGALMFICGAVIAAGWAG